MATAARHREISDQFLTDAETELEKGDLLQASEKAWGAVAHYLKAVAEENGWPHHSHHHVSANARRLVRLTDDPEQCSRFFGMVERLHINFYEEYRDTEDVRLGLNDARMLIDAFTIAERRL